MTDIKNFKGYHGSSTIKRSGVPIEWTQDRIQEYVKCSQDPIYFGETHMKIVNVDQGLMTIPLYDYQKEIINTAKDNRFTVAECSRQSGKALPLDTLIPSANGWKNMKDLKVGDIIFDENGKQTKILSTSIIFYNHDCYKITFDDGSDVVADAEHLWAVERASYSYKKEKKLTTKELFDSGVTYKDSRGKIVSKWKIPILSAPVQYNSKKVSLDPYTLGLWLGDGSAADGRITSSHEDHKFYKNCIVFKFSHNHSKRNLYTGTLYGLSPELRKYNVINNKHIPFEYLYNDASIRISLLQGLMDSDGTVEKNGRLCLALSYSKYPNLIENAYELLVSLGLKVTRKEYKKTNSCRLYFQCPRDKMEVFRLPRKLEKQPKTQLRIEKVNNRYIREIKKINSVPTKCIEVENKSHLFLCSKHFIPTHNTTAMTVFVLWYILFHPSKTVAILANKAEVAREILGRIQLAYEHLPKWLQHGVVEWNKGSFELENGSRVLASATSSNNIRGFSVNCLILDEAAFIENWDQFFTSVFPTISSGQSTKVILVSTVNGLNHFYKITSLARQGLNEYKIISVPWSRVPGRDEKWKQSILAAMNFDYDRFSQEFENEYLGSSGTLIAGWKLKQLVPQIPQQSKMNISQFKLPEKNHIYIGVADVSRGKGLDYSALQIIDVTTMPYEQVCVFRDNMTTPADFAEIAHKIGKMYNSASLLVEINDIGQQMGEILYYDYEYENLLFTESAGSMGKRITQGFSQKNTDKGIRTTKIVKSVGCSMLKLLIEQNQLIINDSNTISELATFSKKGVSYQAEEGCTDDLVMCLVLFGWLTEQKYFKDLTDINTLIKLKEIKEEVLENEMLPLGFINDGHVEEVETVANMEKWLWDDEEGVKALKI